MALKGQLTKFKSKYCQDIVSFFSVEPFELQDRLDRAGNAVKEPVPNKLPTLEGFATKIGVHRDTLHEWANGENKEEYTGEITVGMGEDKHTIRVTFSDAVLHAKQRQQEVLVQNGLFGLYEKTFAKFVATNFTGMKDKTEQDVNVKEVPTVVDDVD